MIPPTADAKAALCCPPITAGQLNDAEATELATLFAALSDPVRLRLLSIVAGEGEVCSCNLEGPLGKSQPTVSHHTKVLADAGLIVGERRGRWMWWRVVPDAIQRLQGSLEGSTKRTEIDPDDPAKQVRRS